MPDALCRNLVRRCPIPIGEGEPILAWFEPDLDHRLCFARSARRADRSPTVGVRRTGAAGKLDGAPRRTVRRPTNDELAMRAGWQSWPIVGRTRPFAAQEHVGAGTLELSHRRSPLAHWKYTLAAASAAHRFVGRFQDVKSGSSGSDDEHLPKLRRGDHGGRRRLPLVQRGARAAGDRFALSVDRIRQAAGEDDPAGLLADAARDGRRLDPALSDDATVGRRARPVSRAASRSDRALAVWLLGGLARGRDRDLAAWNGRGPMCSPG